MFTHLYSTQKLIVLMLAISLVLSITITLSGCGNKGDLFLPEKGSSKDSNVNSKTKSKS